MKNICDDPRITPQAKHAAHIHYVAAFCGGFLGLFPVLNVIHLFGSAQTSNLIEIVTNLIGGDWFSVMLHVCGALLYALAVFLVTFLPVHSKINVKYVSLAVDVIAGFVMWKFPPDLPKTVYMYPTFFAMAFQWSAFSGSYGYVCSTIFSTNNLKQTVSALTEAYCNGKPEFKLKAVFFGATLIGFHLGVAASFILNRVFEGNNISFIFVAVPAITGTVMIKKAPVQN